MKIEVESEDLVVLQHKVQLYEKWVESAQDRARAAADSEIYFKCVKDLQHILQAYSIEEVIRKVRRLLQLETGDRDVVIAQKAVIKNLRSNLRVVAQIAQDQKHQYVVEE